MMPSEQTPSQNIHPAAGIELQRCMEWQQIESQVNSHHQQMGGGAQMYPQQQQQQPIHYQMPQYQMSHQQQQSAHSFLHQAY